jgi:hypothetical protein
VPLIRSRLCTSTATGPGHSSFIHSGPAPVGRPEAAGSRKAAHRARRVPVIVRLSGRPASSSIPSPRRSKRPTGGPIIRACAMRISGAGRSRSPPSLLCRGTWSAGPRTPACATTFLVDRAPVLLRRRALCGFGETGPSQLTKDDRPSRIPVHVVRGTRLGGRVTCARAASPHRSHADGRGALSDVTPGHPGPAQPAGGRTTIRAGTHLTPSQTRGMSAASQRGEIYVLAAGR